MMRIIRTAAHRRDGELADLLQGLWALELLSPSSQLYLVSAWVSDVAVLDNRDGAFEGLGSGLARRRIRLSEVLVHLASRGTNVHVVTNEDPHNSTFVRELRSLSRQHGCEERVRTSVADELHVKGLVTDSFHLAGSMNFTFNGINVLGEEVRLTTTHHEVAQACIDYRVLYAHGGNR